MMAAAILILGAAVIQSVRSTAGASARQAGGEQRSVWAGVYTDEQSQRGEKLYVDACAKCHSTTLAGGAQLTGDVPALVGNEFLGGWVGATAAELFERVRHTVPPGDAGGLTEAQSADVLAYIFSRNRFPAGQNALEGEIGALSRIQIDLSAAGAPAPGNEPPSVPERSVWDGVYSEEQRKRGEKTYVSSCESCHTADLTGSRVVPGLVGNDFLSKWNGSTAGDLFEQIRSTMPQGGAGTLSRQEYSDVLAYIFNKNKFPVGKQDLGDEFVTLNGIRIAPK
jgi:mono/diheme cytochrome c family protein